MASNVQTYSPYNWGDGFPEKAGVFDVVVANVILIDESPHGALAWCIVETLLKIPGFGGGDTTREPHFCLLDKRLKSSSDPPPFQKLKEKGLCFQ